MSRLSRFIHFYTDEDDGSDPGQKYHRYASGTSPLSLINALAKPIKKLIQYGKATVSSGEVVCNNGVLKYGATGKNLANPSVFTLNLVTESDGIYTASDADTASSLIFKIQQYNGNSFISGTQAQTSAITSAQRIRLATTINASATRLKFANNGATREFSIFIPIDSDLIGETVTFSVDIIDATIGSCKFKDIQLERGNIQNPTYEPYTEGFYTEGEAEEIRVTGVNQWDEEWEVGGIDPTTGGKNLQVGRIRSKNFIPCVPNTSYYFISPMTSNDVRIAYYKKDQSFISMTGWLYNGAFTTDAEAYYMMFFTAASYGDTYNHDISINYPSTDHDYHPAHIETATASNLFAVGSVADEQDIISGTVTRRCEAVVSDGSTPSARYIGTVGEGNVIVQALETGYSGSIATFTDDKVESLNGLIVEVEPVQDLHGYDAPWPAGGGKNKLPLITSNIKALNTTGSWSGNVYTINGITYTIQEENNTIVGVSVSGTATANSILVLATEMEVTQGQKLNGSPTNGRMFISNSTGQTDYAVDTGSGGTVNTNATGCRAYIQTLNGTTISGSLLYKPMLREASETDATFAPFANLCPITGHTGVTVYDTGVNVWDEEWESGSYSADTGLPVPYPSRIRAKNAIPVKGGTQYYGKYTNSIIIRYYDADGNFLGSNYNTIAQNSVITTPENARFMRFALEGMTQYNNSVSINYPSTDHDYHAYTGNTYPITFPALGKNQWDEEWENGRFSITTGEKSSGNGMRNKNAIPVLPSTEYRIVWSSAYNTSNALLLYYDADGNYISYENKYSATYGANFTTPSNAYYVNFNVQTSSAVTVYNHDIAINLPSTFTQYEPFTNTVYSGSGDVISGEWEDNVVSVTFDGTEDWSVYAGQNGFLRTMEGMVNARANSGRASWLPVIDDATKFGILLGANNTVGYFCHITDRIPGVTDLDSWKTYLSNHPLQVTYPLATPVPFTTTPQTITTQVGTNNVWVEESDSITAYLPDAPVIEHVSPQKLKTAKGDNTMIVTANVDGIEFDVEYIGEPEEG